MHKGILCLFLAVSATFGQAAERDFDFGSMPLNAPPSGCVSTVAGTRDPGTWKVIEADVPTLLAPMSPSAPSTVKKAVVAQLADNMTDEHFPMLVLGNDVYGDFTLTTRFETVGGVFEQMAGIAFRMQDEKNYYVVRASSLGNNFRFYKVVNGQRGPIIGPAVNVPAGVWHDLTVQCAGNQIHFLLDGKEVIPALTDNTFSSGKIALWTKSDAVTYFSDTKIVYTPHEPFVQGLVHDTCERYPKLRGLEVFMMSGKPAEPHLVASKDEKEIGRLGIKSDADVISNGTIYTAKADDTMTVTLPLHDRNGDVAAAVRVKMKTFKGQTEENAIVRAMPIIKDMEERMPTTDDLVQ